MDSTPLLDTTRLLSWCTRRILKHWFDVEAYPAVPCFKLGCDMSCDGPVAELLSVGHLLLLQTCRALGRFCFAHSTYDI